MRFPGSGQIGGLARGIAVPGGATPLLAAYMSGLTPGAVSVPAGFSFARSGSGRTAQLSASTLTTTDPGANVPVAEWTASGNGLSLFGPTTNLVAASRAWTGTGWTSGSGNTPTTGQASPDGGMSATRQQVTSGGFGPYAAVATSGSAPACASFWAQEGASNPVLHTNFYNGASNGFVNTVAAAWARFACGIALGNAGSLAIFVEGRTTGGLTASALDVIGDVFQVESGRIYASPYVPTAGASATRNGERLYVASAGSVVRGGRLTQRVTFVAPSPSSQLPWDSYLWHVDSNNYAKVSASTRLVTVATGGGSYIAPGVANWLAGDVVTIEHAVGGSLDTYVQLGVNGGALVLLGQSASAQSNAPSSGALDVMCNGTAGQLESMAVQEVSFW